jgi:hypothetical protein
MYFCYHHQWFEETSDHSRQFVMNDWQVLLITSILCQDAGCHIHIMLYYIAQPESTGHVNNIGKLYLDKKTYQPFTKNCLSDLVCFQIIGDSGSNTHGSWNI